MKKRALLSGLALLIILGVSLVIIFPRALSGPQKWSFQTGSGSINAVAPTVANGVIYTGSNRYLSALDAVSGSQKWSFDMTGIIASSPEVANGMVYVAANDAFGHLFALNARSGRKIWSFQTEDYLSSSQVAGGIVYLSFHSMASTGKLYALDALSGRQLWQWSYPVDPWLTSHMGTYLAAAPAVANGLVYVGSNNGHLYALGFGKVIWSFQTNGSITSTPMMVNGIIYVGSYDHNLYALDALSGNKKWSFQTEGPIESTPIVANGLVYVSSDDAKLYALQIPS